MKNKLNIYKIIAVGTIFLTAACNNIKHSEMQNRQLSDNKLQLIINSYNKKVPIKIKCDGSIKDLKLGIWDELGLPIESQNLRLGNKNLIKDEKSLQEYKIYDLDEIDLNLSIKGGMQSVAKIDFGCFFPHFNKNIIKYGDTGSYGCKWRTVTSGVNIAAYCKNENCPSKSYVWIFKGLGEEKDIELGIGDFNVARVASEPVYCSACGNKIAPKDLLGIGFFDCEYKVEGKRLKNPEKFPKDYELEKVRIPWMKTNKHKISKYFSKITGIWTFLELHTK